MSSSFRRAHRRSERHDQSNARAVPCPPNIKVRNLVTLPIFELVGTKPWIGGITLTSSGLRDLDTIFGGGQPIGTAILIEEDRWTQDLALSLIRYWCAEATSQGQKLSLIATLQDFEEDHLTLLDNDHITLDNIKCQQGMNEKALQSFCRMLPRNLNFDKANNTSVSLSKKMNSFSVNESISLEGIATVEEGEDFEEGETEKGDDKDKGLLNAWQYKVSVQKKRLGIPMVPKSNSKGLTFCHSYDLSGKLEDQYEKDWLTHNRDIDIVNCSCNNCPPLSCQNNLPCAFALYKQCVNHIDESIANKGNTVIRMLLMNIPVNKVSLILPLLLYHIRAKSLPVVILVSVRPWLQSLHSNSMVTLRRTCDAVLACEGFAAMVNTQPKEFSDLAGILRIRKMALQSLSHFADSTTTKRPPANRYGMKRDRRKMHIQMLHLPPEDFSAGSSGVGTGVRNIRGNHTNFDSDDKKDKLNRTTILTPGLSCASKSSSVKSLDF